jgi:hypothetical protein
MKKQYPMRAIKMTGDKIRRPPASSAGQKEEANSDRHILKNLSETM